MLNPHDEVEVKNIVIFLNTLKNIGPNSIPTEIFKSLLNDVSSQLNELFNFSFLHGVFPLILKTSKVVPVYKKLKCITIIPANILTI